MNQDVSLLSDDAARSASYLRAPEAKSTRPNSTKVNADQRSPMDPNKSPSLMVIPVPPSNSPAVISPSPSNVIQIVAKSRNQIGYKTTEAKLFQQDEKSAVATTAVDPLLPKYIQLYDMQYLLKKGRRFPDKGELPMAVKRTDRWMCFMYTAIVTLIFSLMGFSVWLSVQMHRRHLLMEANRGYNKKADFTMSDLFNATFQPQHLVVSWLKGDDAYTYNDVDGNIVLYNVSSNVSTVLVDSELLNNFEHSWLSPDLRYVLVASQSERIWRHSFWAIYSILDIANSSFIQIHFGPVRSALRFAGWAVDGNALVFVDGDNNVFYQRSPRHTPVQITTSGHPIYAFNGVPDWLYEEEILKSNKAVWWSPESRYFIFAFFNCSEIPTVDIPKYGDGPYYNVTQIVYPKAGEPHHKTTKVSLYLVDTQDVNRGSKAVPAPGPWKNVDRYVLQVVWWNDITFAVVWCNRVQNESITMLCTVGRSSTANCTENHRLAAPGGWLEMLPQIYFISNDAYFTILPRTEHSALGAFRHIALVSKKKNSDVSQVHYLTSGEEEAKQIVGYDARKEEVYYLTTAGDPRKRRLYRSSKNGSTKCLSCSSMTCTFVSATFSRTTNYYVLGCLGPDVPTYWLRSTINTTLNISLVSNSHLIAALAEKSLAHQEFYVVPIGDGNQACARLWIPPAINYRQTGTTFPLVVEINSNPGSQLVTEEYSIGYHTFLTSSEDIVFAQIDARGTASRGDKFKFQIYRKLADVDLDDQLLATLWLKNNISFINGNLRVAAIGWSYGGFLVSHILGDYSDVFECGIIGAAVIDRGSYATAHGERHMGMATFHDNWSGYESTNVIHKLDGFRDKEVLLVHGTADDHAHFSNAARLAKGLADLDIQFHFQMYTDENHFFHKSSLHLYKLYTDFLTRDCWKNMAFDFEKQRDLRVVKKTIDVHGLPEDKLRIMRNRMSKKPKPFDYYTP